MSVNIFMYVFLKQIQRKYGAMIQLSLLLADTFFLLLLLSIGLPHIPSSNMHVNMSGGPYYCRNEKSTSNVSAICC